LNLAPKKQSTIFNHHWQWWHQPTGKSLAGANTPETFWKREKLSTIKNAKIQFNIFYNQHVQW